MAAAVALALLLAAPPTGAGLERAIEESRRLPSFADRVELLSRLFLGTPYGQFPLGEGEGVEPQPRWRADMVDCQTYVETVLALANSRSLDEAKALLDDIRYGSREVSFSTRNHFAEAQWLPANEAKGYLREETTQIDPGAPVATLVLRRANAETAMRRSRDQRGLAPVSSPSGCTLRICPAKTRGSLVGSSQTRLSQT